MLVLSRRRNESVVIDDVVVTVIEIRGDTVRLGIEAPKQATVHRREVYEAITAQSRREPEGSGAALPLTLPPPRRRVTLTDRQAALVERFRAAIRDATGEDASVAQAVAAIFEAVEEAEEHLTLLVADALRTARSG
jgi:carbon storage regulator